MKINAEAAGGQNSASVFRYRLAGKPSALTLIAPDCDLAEARRVLVRQFGESLVEVQA